MVAVPIYLTQKNRFCSPWCLHWTTQAFPPNKIGGHGGFRASPDVKRLSWLSGLLETDYLCSFLMKAPKGFLWNKTQGSFRDGDY